MTTSCSGAEVVVGGKTYEVGIFENGILSEMNLALGREDEIPLDKLPEAVPEDLRGRVIRPEGCRRRQGHQVWRSRSTRPSSTTTDGATNSSSPRTGPWSRRFSSSRTRKSISPPVRLRSRPPSRSMPEGGTIDSITRFVGIIRPTYEGRDRAQGPRLPRRARRRRRPDLEVAPGRSGVSRTDRLNSGRIGCKNQSGPRRSVRQVTSPWRCR